MTVTCPIHEKPLKLMPAGISKKSGNPYKAFYACTSFNCKETPPAVNEPASIEESKKFEAEADEDYYFNLEVKKFEAEAEEDYSVNRAVKEFEKEIETDINNDDSPMAKSDWRRKDEQIARLTLAKSFIQAGLDFDNAVKNNDLAKWTKWVTTGEVKD